MPRLKNYIILSSLLFLAILRLHRVYFATRNNVLLDVKSTESNIQIVPQSSELENDRSLVLLLAGYRTGSSFLGELFRINPKYFYFFEPLKFLNLNGSLPTRDDTIDLIASAHIRNLFSCRVQELYQASVAMFPDMEGQRQWWLKRFTYRKTGLSKVESICQKVKNVAIKTIRIQKLQYFKQLLQEKFIKVIVLIRDPRGSLQSQTSFNLWRKIELPYNASIWCENLESNINFLKVECLFNSNCSKQYMLVRYEDVAFHPLQMARNIYKFLGMAVPEKVKEWLAKNTQIHKGNLLSTTRVSNQTATAWRYEASLDFVLYIQEHCQSILNALGYNTITEENQMYNKNFNLIADLPDLYGTFPYTIQ